MGQALTQCGGKKMVFGVWFGRAEHIFICFGFPLLLFSVLCMSIFNYYQLFLGCMYNPVVSTWVPVIPNPRLFVNRCITCLVITAACGLNFKRFNIFTNSKVNHAGNVSNQVLSISLDSGEPCAHVGCALMFDGYSHSGPKAIQT